MTPQGYPLWAVDEAGAPYVVVGWDEGGYPSLIPLDGPTIGTERYPNGTVLTFTTTDPTERPDVNAVYYASEDLRDRLARLADSMEGMDRTGTEAARAIRQELDK